MPHEIPHFLLTACIVAVSNDDNYGVDDSYGVALFLESNQLRLISIVEILKLY